MSTPGQPDVFYAYDDANRLTQMTQGAATTSIAYDADGRRSSKTLPNGVTTDYTVDATGRVTSIIFSKDTNILGDLTYQYNSLGQTVSTGGSFARTMIPQAISASNYDAANQQLGFGANSYTFDNDANRLTTTSSAGTINYTWNARNQLTGVSGPGISATYTYDGFGRQQSATVNGSLTEFLYDGFVPIQETAGATTLANNMALPGSNEFIARADSSGPSYFLTDMDRSTLALANASGIIQTEYTYAFFGGASSVSGLASSNPYRFRASYNDATGLRRPLCVCNDSPRIDPISMTQLNVPPPILIPSIWGDPDEPSPASGPEGGRKPSGGGGGGGRGDPSGGEGEGNSRPATSEDPGKPSSTGNLPRPGPMHGPFQAESEWSKRLEAHARDIEFWKEVARGAVRGLSGGLDLAVAAFRGSVLKGLADALGIPMDLRDAAANILGLPDTPSGAAKVLGEMIFNGVSPTQAISNVATNTECLSLLCY